MAQTCIDTCTRCGAEDVKVTIINDDERVCDECLESYFTFCEECEEYWESDAVEFFETKDGRLICEDCYEELNDK